MSDSKKVIRAILNQYCLSEIDFKNSEMVKFFVTKFLDKGIKITNVETILNIGHYKLKKILES